MEVSGDIRGEPNAICRGFEIPEKKKPEHGIIWQDRNLDRTGLSYGPCLKGPVDGSIRLKNRLKENEGGKSGLRTFVERADFSSDRKKSAKEGHVGPEGTAFARSLQDLPDFCPW